jgi:seryl-tRNA synthetase
MKRTSVLFRPSLDLARLVDDLPAVARNCAIRGHPTDKLELLKPLASEYKAARKEVMELGRLRKVAASTMTRGATGTGNAPTHMSTASSTAAAAAAASTAPPAAAGSGSAAPPGGSGAEVREKLAEAERIEREKEEEIYRIGLSLPNSTHPDAPVGSEEMSKIVKTHGEKRVFSFKPKSHIELNEAGLDLFDAKVGALVAGSRFVFLRGDGALLELALVQWAMNRLAQRGFLPTLPPDVVREDAVRGAGFQPRGQNSQVYHIEQDVENGDAEGDRYGDSIIIYIYIYILIYILASHYPCPSFNLPVASLCLAGTSELSLAAMSAGQILARGSLPQRYAGFSHCFRREAGAGGRDAGGLFRLHQFSKVEMFGLCTSSGSDALLSAFVEVQEELYRDLGLHYVIKDMATEDLGAPAYRKFDLEAWMPGRERYGELCSASNCTDYQARRLSIRTKRDGKDTGAKAATEFVHTVNGTAVAVPRVIVALVETHQREDGSVDVPETLWPFLRKERLLPKPKHQG